MGKVEPNLKGVPLSREEFPELYVITYKKVYKLRASRQDKAALVAERMYCRENHLRPQDVTVCDVRVSLI